ncbi:glycosyltransferase family 2 protein [Methanobacterium alcaliphilum]|uniref:glycosyltransferase family 2 protein n=1 Tax=Methanobacterium alcaliphilum TaxID=392018 RepID=UPI00200A1D27|nr:glycosyltransferase family 2 protein [Methanobacterium alcaliphilum]MCK9152411.1 glycosyltransferase family 2 protein [Methanobacterium alcaliphilum]
MLDRSKEKIFIIVPAYNEEKTVKSVIKELCEMGYKVLLIDDGSQDKTYSLGKSMQNEYSDQILIYQHVINRGLGAALKTGMDAAAINGADFIVTFDADGQHDHKDIENICKPLITGEADVVIGKRNFKDMPITRNLGNYGMNIITMIFYGIYVNDSQSGLRGFTVSSTKLLKLHSRGYGVSSEIISEVKKNNLKLKEVPIKTIYTDYTISKGTNTTVALKILFKMIMDILKKV